MPTDWAQFEPETKQTDWSEFAPEQPTPKELGPAFPLQEGEPQQDTSAAQAMTQWFQPAPATNALQIKPLGDVNAPMPEQKPFLQEAQEPAINYQLQHPANEGVLAAVGREAANLALGAAEFPTSEAGAAAGMASAVAPTAVTGLFTLQMMKDLGNQVLSTYQNWGSMTPAQKAIAITDIAGTGVLGFLTGKATAKGLHRMGKTEPAISAAEPILPQAAQAAKETKGAETYATEERNVPQDISGERAGDDALRTPPSPSSSGSLPTTTAIPQTETPSPPTRLSRLLLSSNPTVRVADPSVLVAINDPKILDTVVRDLPVEVMDMLATEQIPSEVLRNNPTMFEESLAVNRDTNIASGVFGALKTAVTGLRAKLLNAFTTGRDVELSATLKASDLTPSEIVRFLAPDGKGTVDISGMPEFTTASARAKLRSLGFTGTGKKLTIAEFAPLADWHTKIVSKAKAEASGISVSESTPPPKETPTAPSAAEPSSQTPATQGISEATTPSEKAQAPTFEGLIARVKDAEDFAQAKGVIENSKNITQTAKGQLLAQLNAAHPSLAEQPSTEPFLGKTKAEWTPEYYKSLSPENRRAARAQVISALKSEGGTTKVTQESKPPVVIKGIHELLDLREKKKAPMPPRPEAGPGMVGMGGAAAGELSESAGADIYGIAQRVREQRAAAGQTPALPRGEGVSALESVQHGRRLIAADPLAAEKAADAFSKTKALSYDGLSAVRAKGEEAFMAARNIEQKFGTDSPEYRNAFEAASRWDKVSKEMQTVWHRTGQAQQGQTDIDTGSFTGLHRAFRAATGKDFTPQQAKQAKEKVAVVQTATAEAEAATKKLFDAIDKVLPQGKAPVDAADARKQLSSFKPGAKPNLEQIRSIWSYVKSVYISRGEANLDTIAQKASDDLGIPKLDIIKAMASPKGARALTDEAFLKLQRQRQAISAAKNWLTTANLPGWERFVRKIPRFFFMTKVFGHGTVGMVTHAGSMAFDPAAMKSYWPVFLKQYGLVFSERYHARLMQELMDDPYFATARRAGLANDPFRYQDDYQNPKLAGWFGRWGLAGNRGFDSLKLLRQARWNEIWDSFPDELKTKEMAKLLADQVNHATGIVRSDVLGRFAEPAGTILFAPKLEMSRWAFAVGDPAKATRIFLSWEKATPEERMFAISEVKQKARIFGVYMGLLALNESILQASGSDQHVNFNNPNRGDFLAFKVAGQNVSIISPMLHMGALLADMIKIGFFKRKGVEKVTPRRSAAAAAIGRYAQGKLSPFAQPIADAWFQSTFENRPMPFSADRAAKWMRQRGMGRWTWPEYLSETFTPIPVSEAIREVWRSQGMNEDEMDQAAKVLAVLTITGGTGVRLSQDIHKGGK